MAEKNTDQDTDIEPEDNRSFEEKFKSFIEKVRPYFYKLWSNRKKIIIFNTAVLIIALTYLLFLTNPYYESTVIILPEYGSKSNMLSQLSGLASLAGVKVGEAAPTEIYQNLITSETVLENVIYAKYRTEQSPDSVNLLQYFEIDESDAETRIKKRTNFLKIYEKLTLNRIATDVDKITKILAVKVRMTEAQLSADIVNELVRSLDKYIRTVRKSYATEQSYYLEKRTAQVKDSLIVAEDKLKSFREQNRIVLQSPNLLLEQGRLMRNVEILQTVFVELTKQLEISKIDQIKDAPVLNVKEYAKNPIKKAGPKRTITLITIMFFSFILSILYSVFNEEIKKYVGIVRGK